MTRLTTGETADRVWFALWDKTYAPANLQSAFEKVWRNGGSAGADEQTVAHFGQRAQEELERLHEQLRDGTYRPQPVRRAWIPKPGSKEKRPLGVPVEADNRTTTNPLTGEPDAGDPPVRFGGRGSGKPLSLPLSAAPIARPFKVRIAANG